MSTHHSFYCKYKYPYTYSTCHCQDKFNGPVDAQQFPLRNLPNPKKPCDAATKKYVDEKTVETQIVTLSQSDTESLKLFRINKSFLRNVLVNLNEIKGLQDRLVSYFIQAQTENTLTLAVKMQSNLRSEITTVIKPSNDRIDTKPHVLTIAGRPTISFVKPNGDVKIFKANSSSGPYEPEDITPTNKIENVLGEVYNRTHTIRHSSDFTWFALYSTNHNPTGQWLSEDSSYAIPSKDYYVSGPVGNDQTGFYLIQDKDYQDNFILYHIVSDPQHGINLRLTIFNLTFNAKDDPSSETLPILLFKIVLHRGQPVIFTQRYYYTTENFRNNEWKRHDIYGVFYDGKHWASDYINIQGNFAFVHSTRSAVLLKIPSQTNQAFIVNNRVPDFMDISASIINSIVAVAYSYYDPNTDRTYIVYARATSNSQPDTWNQQTVDSFQGRTFTYVSLLPVNVNPTIVYTTPNNQNSATLRYVRGGTENGFVADAEFKASIR